MSFRYCFALPTLGKWSNDEVPPISANLSLLTTQSSRLNFPARCLRRDYLPVVTDPAMQRPDHHMEILRRHNAMGHFGERCFYGWDCPTTHLMR